MDKEQAPFTAPTTGDEVSEVQTSPSAGVLAPEQTQEEGKQEGQVAVRLASLPAEQLKSILNDVLESYGSGASIYAIAADMGIEHTTLYRQLLKHREGDWVEAKRSRALAELEDAEEELKRAPDGLALSRARERVRAAQWQLERLMRRIYGQDQHQDSTGRVSITLNIGAVQQSEKIVSDQ